MQTGNLGAILSAGADGMTYSPTGFLSHAAPAEVLLEDVKRRAVRSRDGPKMPGTAKATKPHNPDN